MIKDAKWPLNTDYVKNMSEYHWAWLPHRSIYSGKLIWMEHAYRYRIDCGAHEHPITTYDWITTAEYVMLYV